MKPFLALYRHDRGVVLSECVFGKQGEMLWVGGFNTSRRDVCRVQGGMCFWVSGAAGRGSRVGVYKVDMWELRYEKTRSS